MHPGGACVYSQPHLPKVRRDGFGATVRRKEFHTELLLRRNEELRNVRIIITGGKAFYNYVCTDHHNSLQRMESVLGVAVSGITAAELIRDDILLCRLMNKLHPGMINHEEVCTNINTASRPQRLVACLSSLICFKECMAT